VSDDWCSDMAQRGWAGISTPGVPLVEDWALEEPNDEPNDGAQLILAEPEQLHRDDAGARVWVASDEALED
jgi:hypothetical protein